MKAHPSEYTHDTLLHHSNDNNKEEELQPHGRQPLYWDRAGRGFSLWLDLCSRVAGAAATGDRGRVHGERVYLLLDLKALAVRKVSLHQSRLSRSPEVPPRTGSAPPAWLPAPGRVSGAGCSPLCPSWGALGRFPESSGTPASRRMSQAGSTCGSHTAGCHSCICKHLVHRDLNQSHLRWTEDIREKQLMSSSSI